MKKSEHSTESITVKAPCGSLTEPEGARFVLGEAMAGGVLANALAARLSSLFKGLDLGPSAVAFASDLIRRMDPRDPLEEMLVIQMLMAHVRVLHLTHIATKQTQIDGLRAVNDHADRASNTFRRLLLALDEYRRPRRGHSFTAIGQANIAGQQLVQNGQIEATRNAANEQGFEVPGANEAALPPDAGGSLFTPRVDSAGAAVEAGNRPANGVRQGSVEPERPEAR